MCALYKGIEVPDNDAERASAVERYRILESAPELAYDDIVEIAARICGTKVSYIGFFDRHRLWLKAKYGLPATFHERPREMTLCSPTLLQNDLVVVPDLQQHERYRDLPSVKGPPHARFYCGMPLINPEGYALGTVCVVDLEPRELEPWKQDLLRRLARQIMGHLELRRKLVEIDEAKRDLESAYAALQAEKARGDGLLANMLPAAIAEQLRNDEDVAPRFYDSATVLFADFKDFTRLAETLEPRIVVDQLDDFFGLFDEIVEAHRMEKLKTIGDAYMCVGGLPESNETHPVDACLAALEIADRLARINDQRQAIGLAPWELRIGLHSGPVMAGLVGQKRATYDVWGDAVNIAARMQETGEPGRINISQATFDRVSNVFDCEARGSVEVKNKGAVTMHFLNGIKAELSRDGAGLKPAAEFWTVAGFGATPLESI